MSNPYSNFKGNLVHMCLASHFDIIESWRMNIGHRDTNNKGKYFIIYNVWRLAIL